MQKNTLFTSLSFLLKVQFVRQITQNCSATAMGILLMSIATRFCMRFLRRLESTQMPIGLLGGAVVSWKTCLIWWNNLTLELKRYSDGRRTWWEAADRVFSPASVGFVEVCAKESSSWKRKCAASWIMTFLIARNSFCCESGLCLSGPAFVVTF